MGGYDTIMRTKCNVDGKFYALKRYRYNFLEKGVDYKIKEEIFREVDNLRQLQHPNIIKIEDLVKEKGIPVLIMELCDGTLQDLIDQNKGKIIPEDGIIEIFAMVCEALEYIHKKGVIHRDIKP